VRTCGPITAGTKSKAATRSRSAGICSLNVAEQSRRDQATRGRAHTRHSSTVTLGDRRYRRRAAQPPLGRRIVVDVAPGGVHCHDGLVRPRSTTSRGVAVAGGIGRDHGRGCAHCRRLDSRHGRAGRFCRCAPKAAASHPLGAGRDQAREDRSRVMTRSRSSGIDRLNVFSQSGHARRLLQFAFPVGHMPSSDRASMRRGWPASRHP